MTNLGIDMTAGNPFGNKRHDYQVRIFQGDYHSLQHHWINIPIRASIRLGSQKARVKSVDRSMENDDVSGGVQQAAEARTGNHKSHSSPHPGTQQNHDDDFDAFF